MTNKFYFTISTFLAIYIFSVGNIIAQHKISGNIKDGSTKENLPGVSIYIPNLRTGTITDPNGNYQLTNLKSGNYLFNISYVGYKTIVKEINLTQDTVINFTLTPSITEINEIIITGVSRSTELKSTPIIIKTIDRKELSQMSSTNLIDGLKNIPSINQISTGPAISKPIIRGLGYNRVITLNNGIRQEGQQWGDEHGIEIDQYSIDRVEIIKGPGSLMYGSDGIAGVLNFLAPKALPAGEVKTQIVSNYQTNNNLIAYSISNQGNNENGFQWFGRLTNKFAEDYQNSYDGKVFNSGFKEFDGTLSVGINKKWGYSHLTVSSFNQTINMPEGERDSLGNFIFINSNGEEVTAQPKDYKGYKIGFPHQEINHTRIVSENHFLLKKGTVNANLGFQNNKRKEFGDPTLPNQKSLFFDLNTLNYNIRYNFKKHKGWETSTGIGGMQQSNKNKGVEFLIPQYNLFDAGIFVFTQKQFNSKLTFAGGLRFDNRIIKTEKLYLDSLEQPVTTPNNGAELKFNSFTKNYNGTSGSLGVSYQANKSSTFKFNLSRGYRAPNIAEISSNGRHEGSFRYEIGNPNLKSEISHQIDLAYYLNADHISFSLTPFVNFINHYIYTRKLKGFNGLDSIPDPSEPVRAYQFTSGNATLMGGEIYLDVHPHPLDWLHLENSFAYVQATQNNQPDSLKYLPLIPAPKYRGAVKAQLKNTGKTLSNVFIKFSINHFFQQNHIFSAYNTETKTPAYTLINASIGGDIKAFNRKDFFSLYIIGSNLTNVSYQNHLSRLKYAPQNPVTKRTGIYNMGRNISFKLIINF